MTQCRSAPKPSRSTHRRSTIQARREAIGHACGAPLQPLQPVNTLSLHELPRDAPPSLMPGSRRESSLPLAEAMCSNAASSTLHEGATLTLDETEARGLIRELARTLADGERATAVLRATGFPIERIPAFANFPSPMEFWRRVCVELANGVVPDGLRKLFDEVAHLFPGNSAFHSGTPLTIDVLLICAMKDEYDQVRAVTDGMLAPGWTESHGPSGWTVADASFATSTSVPLRIRTSWATHMGRENAQAVASLLIQEHPARCLAMSGICAGRRDKVALGDVIFADRLWSYDAGKSTVDDGEQRFQGDMLQFHPPLVLIQRMQQVAVRPDAPWLTQRPSLPLEPQEDWILLRLLAGEDPHRSSDFDKMCPDWTAALSRLWQREWVDKPLVLTNVGRVRATELQLLHPRGLPSPANFQVHVAPIATGAAVTEDAGIFPRLATSMRKVLGVEMEASALGVLGELHGVPALVAKGVSDYGDLFKDDRYRNFAARAAAECLIALLRGAVDLLPAKKTDGTTASSAHPAETSAPTRRTTTNVPPAELIQALAEEYPDVRDARALWVRAGGKASEVENISRPQDLWQRLWVRSTQGASVRPVALLGAALEDAPNNLLLLHHLTLLKATSS